MISLTTVSTELAPEERAQATFDVADGDFGGKLMVTRRTGLAVRAALEEALMDLPKGETLYVDTRGVELMDYSFADEALGILASRVASGEYGDKHLVLVVGARGLLGRAGRGRWAWWRRGARAGSAGTSTSFWSRRTGISWRTSRPP